MTGALGPDQQVGRFLPSAAGNSSERDDVDCEYYNNY